MDLASYAYQIWKNAIDRKPELKKIIPDMPNVVYSAKQFKETRDQPEGALVYLRTGEGNDALAWIDKEGNSVTESQFAILKTAECPPTLSPCRALTGITRWLPKGSSSSSKLKNPLAGSSAAFRSPLPDLRKAQSPCRELEGNAV